MRSLLTDISTNDEGGAIMRLLHTERAKDVGLTPLWSLLTEKSIDDEGGAIMRPTITQNDEGRRQYSPEESTGQKLDRRRMRRYHAPT
jgi:hypothetical protein